VIRILAHPLRHTITSSKLGTPNGGVRDDDVTATFCWFGQGCKDALCASVKIKPFLRSVEDDGKFIATSAEGFAPAGCRYNPVAGSAKKAVARVVTEVVVHHFQIVQIENEQCPVSWLPLVKLRQGCVKSGAIGQTGKTIVERTSLVFDHTLVPFQGYDA
jgi:hypothetical protein